MINALDDLDWKHIFHRNRGDSGGGRNKFTILYRPIPMVLDFPSNVFRLMEWINRYGRATVNTQRADALLLPVGDHWFVSNLDKEDGVFLHCCEPQKFFQYYDNYVANYTLFMEQPRKAFRSTPYLTIARDMLWSMFNCVGKNYHYAKEKPPGFVCDDTGRVILDAGRVVLDADELGLVDMEVAAKHRCSRCPSEIPNRARAVRVIRGII